MTLALTEADVQALLDMPAAVDAVEAAFRAHGAGAVTNVPRARLKVAGGVMMTMSATLEPAGAMGTKTYTVSRAGGARFHVNLYDLRGEFLALVEANAMGEIRTGAASAVAVRHLTSPGPLRLGIIGSGRQARTQLAAIATVREMDAVHVFSPSPERRDRFAVEMADRLGIAVRAVATAREAVEDMGCVVTITTAREPVFEGAWLREGALVCAAGNNYAEKQEIDLATFDRASLVVVDDRQNAMLECGDLVPRVTSGRRSWEQVDEIGALLHHGTLRPVTSGVAVFESQGVAFEDMAVAAVVYERARQAGRGHEIWHEAST